MEITIQKVPASHGLTWFSQGYALFKRAPFTWLGMLLAYALISVALGFFPVIGRIAGSLIGTLFSGGFMIASDSVARGNPLRFEDLFEGFRRNPRELLLISVISVLSLGIIIGIGICVFLLTSPSNGMEIFRILVADNATRKSFAMNNFVPSLIAVWICILLFLPLLMAIWFAPAAVVLKGLNSIEAMKLSFRGYLANIVPFLVYGVAFILLCFLAVLPLGLGLLILVPVGRISVYTSFSDIFGAEQETRNTPAPQN